MRLNVFILTILLTITFQTNWNLFAQQAVSDDALYYNDRVYLKLKDSVQERIPEFKKGDLDDPRSTLKASKLIDPNAFGSSELLSIEKPFSNIIPSRRLSRIYEVRLEETSEENLKSIIAALSADEQVEFAERVPIYRKAFTPNDEQLESQWYLEKIQAYAAWDEGPGSSAVVLAVVDDAVMTDHPDLAPILWTNPGEIADNGLDDDGNGYIDDIHGFDVADEDNNSNPPGWASFSEFSHGTHVAGIACANTNNSIGIAGIGYNVSLMGIKCNSDNELNTNQIVNGWAGVLYAIDAGADVINISWGSHANSYSAQAIIAEANAQGITIVAAAGNGGTSVPFYPAAYDDVIGVGSLKTNDEKASSSNYGPSVDIMAPGSSIYSTVADPTLDYYYKGGTSMASPVVAGAVAWLKSKYPDITPAQLNTCIMSSADNINAMNSAFVGMIGSGRLNMYQAYLECMDVMGAAGPAQMCTTVPTGFNVISPTSNSAVLTCSPVVGAEQYEFAYRPYGGAWSTFVSDVYSYQLTGLGTCMEYDVKVRAICAGGQASAYTNELNFSTIGDAIGPTYCPSYATDQFNNEYIQHFSLGDINNTSGADNGYGNYNCTTANLNMGETYTLSLTPGYTSLAFPEYVKVWIDYNGDGDFNDAGEEIYNSGTGVTSTVTANIAIPLIGQNGAAPGITRLRASIMWYSTGATQNACDIYSYGEVEDYLVNLNNTVAPCPVTTGLMAPATTETTATLTWSPTASATSYLVEYRQVGVSSWQSTTTTAQFAALSGLLPGTTYEYKVLANCAGSFSAPMTFTTSAGACATPSEPSSTNITENSAQLSWVSTADNFTVKYRQAGSSSWEFVNVSASNTTLTGLNAGVIYQWQVLADCGVNDSDYTNIQSFATETAPCPEVNNVNVSDVTEDSANVSFNGTMVPGNTFEIAYKKSTASSWQTSISYGLSNTLSDLDESSTYFIKVRTVCNGLSYSDYTPVTSFTTTAAPVVCIPPTGLGTTSVDENSATLVWATSSSASSYTVYYRKVGQAWSQANTTNTYVTVYGLEEGSNYEFKVSSNCGGSSSDSSSTAYFVTLLSIDCAVPTSINASDISFNTATINWDGTDGTDEYILRIRKSGTSAWSNYTASNNSYALSELLDNTTYQVQVASVCGTESSDYSVTYYFSTLEELEVSCLIPSGLDAVFVSDAVAILQWNEQSGAEYYTVKYRILGGTIWSPNVTFENSTELTGLMPATSYEFVVKVKCADGVSTAYSPAQTFTTQTSVICTVPTELETTPTSDDQVVLSWMDVADNYLIAYKETVSSSWVTVNVSDNAYTLSGLDPCKGYNFRVRSLCGSSNESDYSDLVTAVSPGCDSGTMPDNCLSQGYNANYEYIAGVNLNTLNNTTGSNAGYGDFTAMTTELSKGSTYAITLSPGYASSAYNEYWRVWIDFNKDGDFSDAGEMVYDAGQVSNTIVTGNIVIPDYATLGLTRMRVSMRYNEAAGPCEFFSYGEVEDYGVIIMPASEEEEETAAPAAIYCDAYSTNANYEYIDNVTVEGGINNTTGSNGGYLDATDKVAYVQAGSTVSFSLTPGFATNAYNEFWGVYIDWNQDGSFNGPNELVYSSNVGSSNTINGVFTVPTNAEDGITRMRITMKYNSVAGPCDIFNYGEVEDYSIAVNMEADEEEAPVTVVNYCTSAGNNSNYEWIEGFSMGDINNQSGNDSGYGLYNFMSTTLTSGNTYSATLIPGYAASPYPEYWRIWIDLNGDGDFSDANELVYDMGEAKKNTQTADVVIPAVSESVTTRMRVSMRYKYAPEACEDFNYGEVEDYTVNILPSGDLVAQEGAEDEDCEGTIQIQYDYETEGMTVQFENLTEGEYTDIIWMIADEYYTTPNPTHTFTAPGEYTVNVIVTNADTGCTENHTNVVYIFAEGDSQLNDD